MTSDTTSDPKTTVGGFLRLKERKPINKGNARLVFEHPEDPALIVKVLRPDVIERRFGKGTSWYKRNRRSGKFLSFVREIQEYIAVYAAHGCAPPFLQKIVGLVETDLGLGLVSGVDRSRAL